MSEDTQMRRVPRQARSQQRVTQILDAAAQLFEETGFEHTTTNAIAARAGVAIGSLYQFFPNKESIMDALMERYMKGVRDKLDYDLSIPLTEMIDQLVDNISAFEHANAGFRALFMSPTLETQMHSEIVQRTEEMIGARFPGLNPAVQHDAAVVTVGIVKMLLPLHGGPDQLPEAVAIRETKLALVGYIRAVLVRERHPLPPDLE